MTARTRVPASMLAQRAVEPTSSVERACRILRALSDPGVTRLTDIAVATGLDKTTALRLLDVLARDGFVVRDARTKHYRLGAELLVLGAAALARFDPRPLARPSLLRLTGRFEDSVILSIPSGIESLCVDVEEGRYPIRANYLSIGSHRPLGVGAGSLALLADAGYLGFREARGPMGFTQRQGGGGHPATEEGSPHPVADPARVQRAAHDPAHGQLSAEPAVHLDGGGQGGPGAGVTPELGVDAGPCAGRVVIPPLAVDGRLPRLEVVALARAGEGGAVSSYEIERRRSALGDLDRAARRALVGACSGRVD